MIGSPFQADQLRLWLTNRYHPWIYRPDDVAREARSVEVLEPVLSPKERHELEEPYRPYGVLEHD